MFLRCPLQYYYRYVTGAKVPPTGDLTLGKCVHLTLKNNYTQKAKSRENLPLDTMLDFFSDSWERRFPDIKFLKSEDPKTIKDDGYRVLKQYYSDVAGKIQPVKVEQGFLINVDGLGKPLMGYIDLVDEDGYIIDHKVSKRSMQEGKVHTDPQLTAYSLAHRKLTAEKEKGLRFDIMVRTKTPKIQQLETHRGENSYRRLGKLLRHADMAIRSGIYYPNENYLCGTCGYKSWCDDWENGGVPDLYNARSQYQTL